MKSCVKIIYFIMSVFHVLSACAPTSVLNEETSRAEVTLDESYVLGPGDELNIVVYNHEDLSGLFTISESGAISLPLVGEIPAAGRTVDEVRQDYTKRLTNGYLIDPRVSVNISTYRPFFIIGGVNQPGAYPYQTGMTILHAIALAGGHSDLAIRSAAPMLLRGGGVPEAVSVRTPVYPGDVIEIPARAAN